MPFIEKYKQNTANSFYLFFQKLIISFLTIHLPQNIVLQIVFWFVAFIFAAYNLFCLRFKGFTIQMAFVHVLISKN